MSVKLCRLCLSNDRLIHMFDGRLNSQQQLRTCILLGTGVDIQPDDLVSRHVCHNCCIIAVKLFKYRQNAIASDRALKEYINQKTEDHPLDKEEVTQLHRSLIESLSNTELKWSSEDHKDVTVLASNISNDSTGIKSKSTKGYAAVHASVRKLFSRFPKIVIPNEVLPFDIEPTVTLRKDRIHDLLRRIKSERSTDVKVTESNLEAIDRLKQTCPSLNIVRIKSSIDKDSKDESKSNPLGISILTKDTTRCHFESFKLEQIKRKRSSSTNSQESSEVVKVKQRRVSNNKSESSSDEMMCTSPFTALGCGEGDHNYFSIDASQDSEPVDLESRCKSQNAISVPTTSRNDLEENQSDEGNQAVSLCNFCGRIYDCEDELELHKNRMHPACYICKQRQKSPISLSAHLNEICYKNIENNQPKLELTRVNEIPEIREKYKNGFDCLLNVNENEDDPVEIVNEFNYMSEIEFEEAVTPSEHEFLSKSFARYKNSESLMKSKYTRMQMSDIKIRYDVKNRIIIENIYPDLKVFKVPLNLKVASKVVAHVSTAPKVKIDDAKESWDASKAIDVKPKFNYVVTNNLDMPNLVVSDSTTTSGNIQNILLFQPTSSVAQTSGVTCTTPKIIVKQNTSKNVKETINLSNTSNKSYISLMKQPESNINMINTLNGITLRDFFVPKKAKITGIQQPSQTNATNSPVQKYNARIIVNTHQPKQTEVRILAPVPTTTASDKPKQAGQSLLRVKAPWEINNQLLKQ